MAKVLELIINGKTIPFKDKKVLYKYLDNHPNNINGLNEKYVNCKSYKHIKNIYQYVFNYFNSTSDDIDYSGKCSICGQPTEFNILTKKYSRFDKQECIDKYKAQFKERMNKVHGRDYYTQDTEALKHMLNNRSITSDYKIDKFTFKAVGEWERDFLDFMFKILKCNPADLIEAPFVIPYEYNGQTMNYFPDFYVPSLNLLIEIKASNNHYEKRDREQNMSKAKAALDFMRKKNGFYFLIYDKNYFEFLTYLKQIINSMN